MTAGIEDVARAAGVSTATVSRALRGLPNVNPATREKVVRTAHELGYVATPSAASLASGRTRTIGLISPSINRWFSSTVIEGAETALRAQGFDVLLYTFAGAPELRRPHVDPGVLRRRVDGVLVVGLPLEEPEIDALRSLGYPLVCIGWGAYGLTTVGVDDRATADEATRHLLSLGHRRIAHMTGPPEDSSPWSPPVIRLEAWRQTLADAGVTPGPVVHGDFSVARARHAARGLLALDPEVTAIFVSSDEMAMGAILGLRDMGRHVPDDVSVIGVDGHEMSEVVGLTTMAQDAAQQGATGARLVLDMISGVSAPAQVVFSTTLIHRTSTAPPRAR